MSEAFASDSTDVTSSWRGWGVAVAGHDPSKTFDRGVCSKKERSTGCSPSDGHAPRMSGNAWLVSGSGIFGAGHVTVRCGVCRGGTRTSCSSSGTTGWRLMVVGAQRQVVSKGWKLHVRCCVEWRGVAPAGCRILQHGLARALLPRRPSLCCGGHGRGRCWLGGQLLQPGLHLRQQQLRAVVLQSRAPEHGGRTPVTRPACHSYRGRSVTLVRHSALLSYPCA